MDKDTRLAIAHTVDYDTIIETILKGYGGPDGGFIGPSNQFWHNPEVDELRDTMLTFDLDLARDMLADIGYQWDEEGRIYYPEEFLEIYPPEALVPPN